MATLRDEFLSEEDLDLRTMTDAELHAYWDMWLQQAQITNDQDEHTYSHGVFVSAPGASASAVREGPVNQSAEPLPAAKL